MVPPWRSEHHGSDRGLVTWDDQCTYVQNLAFWDILHSVIWLVWVMMGDDVNSKLMDTFSNSIRLEPVRGSSLLIAGGV